jgi:hypothetical protein
LIVVAVLMVSFGFIKSELLIGSSYGLTNAPNVAGNKFFLMSILLIVFSIYFICFKKHGQLANLFLRIFRIITGGLIALFFVTLPNLLLGGIYSFAASINRILFGVISYGSYGIIWSDYDGWNNRTPLIDKIKGFIDFQYKSDIPFLWMRNLALWVICIIVISYLIYCILCYISKKTSQPNDSGKKEGYLLSLPLLFLSVAILFDFTATFRKPGGLPCDYYHIYSSPIYLIAISTSFSLVLTKIIQIYKLKNIVLIKMIVFAFFAGFLIYYPIRSQIVISWHEKETKAAKSKYIERIGIVADGEPSFFLRHGITPKDFIVKLTSGSGVNQAK